MVIFDNCCTSSSSSIISKINYNCTTNLHLSQILVSQKVSQTFTTHSDDTLFLLHKYNLINDDCQINSFIWFKRKIRSRMLLHLFATKHQNHCSSYRKKFDILKNSYFFASYKKLPFKLYLNRPCDPLLNSLELLALEQRRLIPIFANICLRNNE